GAWLAESPRSPRRLPWPGSLPGYTPPGPRALARAGWRRVFQRYADGPAVRIHGEDFRSAHEFRAESRVEPIGPWANTATGSPNRTRPLSAAEKPVEAISDSCTSPSESLCGITARFARANGMRAYPALRRRWCFPAAQPPSGGHTLRSVAPRGK